MNASLPASDYRRSIPSKFDAYLGPSLFHPFALDMAERIPAMPPRSRVLEISCGTGRLTELLRGSLPSSARLDATDLSEPTLEAARQLHPNMPNVEWRQEDMGDLHCLDGCYEAMFCQFGTTLCESTRNVFAEAFRVLRRGGRFIFNMWDGVEYNDLPRMADAVVHFAAPGASTAFPVVGSHRQIRDLLLQTGFRQVEIETVHKTCIMPSAHDAAIGLIEGTPRIISLLNAGIDDPHPTEERLERDIAALFGDHPVRSRMQAIVCTAHKG